MVAQAVYDQPTPTDVDTLEPFGLGWRWKWRREKTWVQLTFRSVRQGASGPSAQVTVEAGVPMVGVRGVLTVERLSLGDGNGRVKLANRLSKRTGEGETAPLDWRNMIDGICSRILVGQQSGPELRMIGTTPEKGANWMIEDLVEHHQSTSIYGDGEVGKSWLVLAACVSAATGIEIVPGWRPTARVLPLYLDWETDEETMNRRVRMICRGAGIDYIPIPYVACDSPLIDQLEWLLERVDDDGIGLLAIDSVEAAMAGSRSEGSDQNDSASKINQVLRKVGRSALLVDHVNSLNAASKGLAGKAYGSIFKRNWVRVSYEVKRTHEGQEAGDAHIGVFNTKRNNGPRFDPRGLLWTINDELTSWSTEQISASNLTAALPLKKRMQIVLEEQGEPISPSTLAELCEATLSNVRVEISRDKGQLFRKTPNGHVELARAEPEQLPWN